MPPRRGLGSSSLSGHARALGGAASRRVRRSAARGRRRERMQTAAWPAPRSPPSRCAEGLPAAAADRTALEHPGSSDSPTAPRSGSGRVGRCCAARTRKRRADRQRGARDGARVRTPAHSARAPRAAAPCVATSAPPLRPVRPARRFELKPAAWLCDLAPGSGTSSRPRARCRRAATTLAIGAPVGAQQLEQLHGSCSGGPAWDGHLVERRLSGAVLAPAPVPVVACGFEAALGSGGCRSAPVRPQARGCRRARCGGARVAGCVGGGLAERPPRARRGPRADHSPPQRMRRRSARRVPGTRGAAAPLHAGLVEGQPAERREALVVGSAEAGVGILRSETRTPRRVGSTENGAPNVLPRRGAVGRQEPRTARWAQHGVSATVTPPAVELRLREYSGEVDTSGGDAGREASGVQRAQQQRAVDVRYVATRYVRVVLCEVRVRLAGGGSGWPPRRRSDAPGSCTSRAR